MGRYILRRIISLIVVTICVAILIFTVMYFIPGDPMDIIMPEATVAEKEAMRESLGLNESYIVQLGTYLYDTFIRFDFGTSYALNSTVISELANRVPRTLLLSWMCILLDALIGIPLGIAAAMHRNSWIDRGLMLFAMIGVSLPNFWLALMLVVVFSLNLGWLPSMGIATWKGWILPIVSNTVGGLASNARQTRSAVLETIRADFVTTARAKGVSENGVIYKHMLPNAMIPIINGLGSRLATSIAGTVVIEQVFSFPGVGTYLITGINSRDYPVVRSSILVLAVFSAVVMLLVDLIYAYIDPRIKAQYQSTGKKKGGK